MINSDNYEYNYRMIIIIVLNKLNIVQLLIVINKTIPKECRNFKSLNTFR